MAIWSRTRREDPFAQTEQGGGASGPEPEASGQSRGEPAVAGTPPAEAEIDGISRQAGMALANARSVEELKARQGRLEAMIVAAREIARIQPQSALLASVARACASIIGTVAVNIRVLEGDDLVQRGAWGLPKDFAPRPRLKIGQSLAGQVAATGEPLLLMDPYGDPRLIPEHRLHRQFFRYRAYLGLPLRMGDRIVGVMSIYTRRAEGFSAGDVAAAGAIASHVAVALENARLYREVQEARDQLRELSRSLVESREIERRHLARELHDEIGQALTGLKLALEARHPRSAADASGHGAPTQALLRDVIERVRGLSLDLRPQMLDDLGLLPALAWHFDRFTDQTRVAVRFEQSGLEGQRFDRAVETAAYRIVQEALTNAARHARVEHVVVRLWTAGHVLYVQVEDEGTGFATTPASRRSSGLAGMRERAALLGGSLLIDSARGAGTRLTAELPLTSPAGDPDGGA